MKDEITSCFSSIAAKWVKGVEWNEKKAKIETFFQPLQVLCRRFAFFYCSSLCCGAELFLLETIRLRLSSLAAAKLFRCLSSEWKGKSGDFHARPLKHNAWWEPIGDKIRKCPGKAELKHMMWFCLLLSCRRRLVNHSTWQRRIASNYMVIDFFASPCSLPTIYSQHQNHMLKFTETFIFTHFFCARLTYTVTHEWMGNNKLHVFITLSGSVLLLASCWTHMGLKVGGFCCCVGRPEKNATHKMIKWDLNSLFFSASLAQHRKVLFGVHGEGLSDVHKFAYQS